MMPEAGEDDTGGGKRKAEASPEQGRPAKRTPAGTPAPKSSSPSPPLEERRREVGEVYAAYHALFSSPPGEPAPESSYLRLLQAGQGEEQHNELEHSATTCLLPATVLPAASPNCLRHRFLPILAAKCSCHSSPLPQVLRLSLHTHGQTLPSFGSPVPLSRLPFCKRLPTQARLQWAAGGGRRHASSPLPIHLCPPPHLCAGSEGCRRLAARLLPRFVRHFPQHCTPAADVIISLAGLSLSGALPCPA